MVQLTTPHVRGAGAGAAPALSVRGVSKRYGRSTVLRDFSLSVSPGEVHGLLGPNGSGKSTALHIISGLVVPDGGTVTLSGVPVEKKESRRHLGLAPDDLALPTTLTGSEYVDFHAAMRGRSDDRRRDHLIDALGMRPFLDRAVGDYSHGMKRKIQIVAATCHAPELVVLDEPMRGLDPDAGLVLRHLIRQIATSGRAVLIATHDMLRAERDCDAVTILDAGVTVAQGAPHHLIAGSNALSLEEVFMERTGLTTANAQRIDQIDAAFASAPSRA